MGNTTINWLNNHINGNIAFSVILLCFTKYLNKTSISAQLIICSTSTTKITFFFEEKGVKWKTKKKKKKSFKKGKGVSARTNYKGKKGKGI